MAVSVLVCHRSECPPLPNPNEIRVVEMTPEELFSSWEEKTAGSLFASDFLGTISFADYWYHYAVELDLPLIRAIDDPGLIISGDDLDRFDSELSRLEERWASLDFSDEEPKEGCVLLPDGTLRASEPTSFHDYLLGGTRTLRRAIEIARKHDALLVAY